MKKFILPFLLLMQVVVLAQNNTPVLITTKQSSINGKPYLVITAKANATSKLLSIVDAKDDLPLATTIVFDSSSTKYLNGNIEEKGNVITLFNATKPDSIHIINDSVQWLQPLQNNTTNISGAVNYLLLNGNEFVSGNYNFSQPIVSPLVLEQTNSADNSLKDKTVSLIFITCFLFGLAAVLTPCVFPLLPVTISFFLKKSKTRKEGLINSIWYSLSIILIYTIPTIILVSIFGETIMYKISTHPITNLVLFAIFLLFGISLLGAFELTLPSSWATAADKKAGRDFKGIFFMAVTLVIVSFSCTGPILGIVLSEGAKSGSVLKPIFGMLGFSIGLALPFALCAIFPTVLNNLPKSGGWLNMVKVCFGFLELALALKFLSNVDLIYHWKLLDRDIFLSVWIVLFMLLGFYLLGKIKLSHDSDTSHVSLPRLFIAIISFSFAVYLVPGLWGDPLTPLSGIIPPNSNNDFNLDKLQYNNNNSVATNTDNKTANPPQKLVGTLHVPFGINAYFDLEEGMAAAAILQKPVMLDFTGHSCANCRKMEEQVWRNPEVLQRLKNDFVLISLYVDESTPLPANEQYTNKQGQKITTVGEKNLDYEITKFGFNAQPLYMFLDNNGNTLSNVLYGYDSDVNKFIKHLDNIKAAYKKTLTK
ncbi:MAG: protein-disulfide reductase DsbD family protein [Chitinophagaceae bacterium]